MNKEMAEMYAGEILDEIAQKEEEPDYRVKSHFSSAGKETHKIFENLPALGEYTTVHTWNIDNQEGGTKCIAIYTGVSEWGWHYMSEAKRMLAYFLEHYR